MYILANLWGFQFADFAVVAGIALALIYIGVRSSRRIKNQEDFFLGGRSEAHYIRVGRIFNILFLLLCLGAAFYFTGLVSMVKFILGFNSIIGAAFLLGMIWRRATRVQFERIPRFRQSL